MPNNFPLSSLNDTQAIYILKERQGLFIRAKKIAELAKKNAELERDLKCTIAARTALRAAADGTVINGLTYDGVVPVDFNEALVTSLKSGNTPPARPVAGGAATSNELARANYMTKMFLNSLRPDGILAGKLEIPTDSTDTKDNVIKACGFAIEEDFINYFREFFAPQAIRNICSDLLTNAKLSQTQKNQMMAVFSLLISHKDDFLVAGASGATLKARLIKMLKKLKEQKQEQDVLAQKHTAGFSVSHAPLTLDPAIAQLEAITNMSDVQLQQRFDYLKLLTDNAQEMLNTLTANFDDNPIISSYSADGDNSDPSKMVNNKSLMELREELENPNSDIQQKIVQEFDNTATDVQSRNNRANELKNEEKKIRDDIWENRKQECDELLKLLPEDLSEEYENLYNKMVHDKSKAAGADIIRKYPQLTGRKDLTKFIAFFESLKNIFLDNTPPIAQEKSDTLLVINRLLSLAKEMRAEEATYAANAHTKPADLTKAPDETDAKQADIFSASQKRKTEEAQLAGVLDKGTLNKEKSYGDAANLEGSKAGVEDTDWEKARLTHLQELMSRIVSTPTPTPTPTPTTSGSSYAASGAKYGAVLAGGTAAAISGTATAAMDGHAAAITIATTVAGAVGAGTGAILGGAGGIILDVGASLVSSYSSPSSSSSSASSSAAIPGIKDSGIVAVPFDYKGSEKEEKDKPLVNLDVNLARGKTTDKTSIIASRNFCIGRDGKFLSPDAIRLKVIDLFMFDQAGHGYWENTGQDTLTKKYKCPPPAGGLPASGCDNGKGRLSDYLNTKGHAKHGLREVKKDATSGALLEGYVCMIDPDPNTPTFKVWWAKFDKNGNAILDSLEPVNQTLNNVDEYAVIIDLMATMALDGLSVHYKERVALDAKEAKNLTTIQAKATSAVIVKTVSEESDKGTKLNKAALLEFNQETVTALWKKTVGDKSKLKHAGSGYYYKAKKGAQEYSHRAYRKFKSLLTR